MQLTGAGWAALFFVFVVVAAVVIALVVYRSRQIKTGFDLDEAAHYVWGNLDRNQKQRIALTHVVAALEAEQVAGDEIEGETELKLVVGEAAHAAGAVLYEKDLDDLLRLQYEYATQKGLM